MTARRPSPLDIMRAVELAGGVAVWLALPRDVRQQYIAEAREERESTPPPEAA